MARFVSGMGGTTWGNIATQYYQSNYNGNYSTIGNPRQQLAGVWHDNTNAIHDNLSPIDLRAKQHERCNSFTRPT